MIQQRPQSTARTWLWFVVVGTLVGAIVGFIAGLAIPPTYAGQSTILVSPIPRDTGITNGDIEVTRAAAATLGELATTSPVLDRVILSTGIDTDVLTLQKTVTTRVPVGTSLVDVTVTSRNAVDAAQLANAIARELVDYPTRTSSAAGSSWQVDVAVVDPASPPTVPEGLGLLLTTILAAGISMLIAISLAFLIENLRGGDAELDSVDPSGSIGGPASVNWPDARDERGDLRQPSR